MHTRGAHMQPHAAAGTPRPVAGTSRSVALERRRTAATAAAAAANLRTARRRRLRHATPCLAPRHRRDGRVWAIGFDLPGAEQSNKSAEKAAEELTRGAASLLLYSAVLKGKPAQAFLGVVTLLQKGSPLVLVQQYGELFRTLAADEHASWADYLLEQIIKASDNPLARAAATGKPTAHLAAAAAHDLDALQQLAVLERTLATFVRDTAYGVGDAWLEAAASLAPREAPAPAPLPEALLAGGPTPPCLLAPLTSAQRAGLRAEIAGKWKWSEAVELLVRYHSLHGCGLVSQHSVLTWTGKLQAQDVLRGAHELAAAEQAGLVAPHHGAAATLTVALTDFLRQDPRDGASPPHVAVCGPATDRWLYTVWALQRLESQVPAELQAAAAGLRTLVLPVSQIGSLGSLAWSLSQHRARFAVVVASLEGGLAAGELAAMLSGFDGFSWPPNAMLLAGYAVQPPAEVAPAFRHIATICRDD